MKTLAFLIAASLFSPNDNPIKADRLYINFERDAYEQSVMQSREHTPAKGLLYFSEKSRSEGEKDLFDLACGNLSKEEAYGCRINGCHQKSAYWNFDHAALEEAWLFDSTKWLEIGYNHSYYSVTPDISLLGMMSGDVSMYHFHPVDGMGKADDSQLISDKDMAIALKFMEYAAINHPKMKTDFRVVVSAGIYTVNINSCTINDEKLKESYRKSISFINMEAKKINNLESVLDYSQGNRENFAKVNMKLAKMLSNDAVTVTFIERE